MTRASSSAHARPSAKHALILLALFIASVAACDDKPAPAPAVSASVALPPPATASAAPDLRVQPVYPAKPGPPAPLAQRYCDAVQALPDRRRNECCPDSPSGFPQTDACVRTLSYALADHAISIDGGDLDKCVDAMTKDTRGCDWVSFQAPTLPAACDGILHGSLQAGATCRSSLECAGSLRCQDLSATEPGKCGPARAADLQCGVGIDTLASTTRQDRYEKAHPECEGYCVHRACKASAALGAACESDVQCGRARCEAKKCTDAPPPAAGQPCTSACAEGSRCIGGACAAIKSEGEACASDAECRLACEAPDAGIAAACAKHCPVIVMPHATPHVVPRPKR